jgi:hypothetical protein
MSDIFATDDRPGVPLWSGFTYPEDQEYRRELLRDVQRKIAPKIESVRLARLRAMEDAHNFVIGASEEER